MLRIYLKGPSKDYNTNSVLYSCTVKKLNNIIHVKIILYNGVANSYMLIGY